MNRFKNNDSLTERIRPNHLDHILNHSKKIFQPAYIFDNLPCGMKKMSPNDLDEEHLIQMYQRVNVYV